MNIFCFLLSIGLLVQSSLPAQSITLSGSPAPLVISSAIAGQQPAPASDSSTTYGIVALLLVRSIVGNLNANMPSGTALRVQLAPPVGATSAGSVAMTTTNTTLVSGIPILALQSGLAVTYTFSATVSAAKATNATRVLTLTVQ